MPMRPDEVLLTVLRLGLALLLYGFLAIVLYLLWRDLRRAGRGEIYPRPEGRLVVVEAGEQGPEVGTVFPLQEIT
ncbi:MAG: FHA domain-containing protein, partial [Thermoflexia bacterium]